MPLSTDVNLSKSQQPVFPDRCVACQAVNPGHSIRVGTNAIGWWTVAFWVPGHRFTIEAPACPPCAATMKRQRRLRLFMCGVIAIAGLAVAFWLLQGQRGRGIL